MSIIWEKPTADFQITQNKCLLEGNFKKKSNKERILQAYPNYILMFKPKQAQPKSILPIKFDVKFEIDEGTGALNFVFIEETEDPVIYDLYSDINTLMEWKKFLQLRFNQWKFHEHFEVQKRIGKGSFASVYLAERKEDSIVMAIKAFSKSAAYAEENGKSAIINEINIMRQINHPNLLKLYQVYETQNSLYLAMDLLEGGSLHEMMKGKHVLTTKQIQIILVCMLSGLRYMHEQDIMHRDLKLENILFRDKKLESLVIGDFGLSTYVHEKVYLYCRCGTPGYVAPEVINIKDLKSTYSSVCDIYSVGLIFYLLLTNKHAFDAKSYSQIVKQNRAAQIDFSLKQLEYTPQDGLNLLKKMLEKDPKKRITADKCLSHPFLKDVKIKVKSETEIEIDYIDETDEGIADKMDQFNIEYGFGNNNY